MFTLTKSQRLKTPADFQRVYQTKQWGNTSLFTFNVLASNGVAQRTETESERTLKSHQGYFGVTVSKKVSKRAVDRNRIKRQVREFYRQHQFELAPASLVITAKPACLGANDQQRAASLAELWSKVLKWQRWHQHQLAKKAGYD